LGSRASIARFARAFFGFRIAMDISKTHVRTLPKEKKSRDSLLFAKWTKGA
jgi:hypothetical protein